MKKFIKKLFTVQTVSLVAIAMGLAPTGSSADTGALYSKLTPVSFAKVHVNDAFWTPRIETVQSETIPDLLKIADNQGKLNNFAIVAGKKEGKIATAQGLRQKLVHFGAHPILDHQQKKAGSCNCLPCNDLSNGQGRI